MRLLRLLLHLLREGYNMERRRLDGRQTARDCKMPAAAAAVLRSMLQQQQLPVLNKWSQLLLQISAASVEHSSCD